jgi:hypothetical protein
LFSIYPAISGYAILRYQLFNVKVVSTQIFLFSLWLFIFVRILLSGSLQEQMLNLVLLIITFILGLLLNQSIVKGFFFDSLRCGWNTIDKKCY